MRADRAARACQVMDFDPFAFDELDELPQKVKASPLTRKPTASLVLSITQLKAHSILWGAVFIIDKYKQDLFVIQS